MSSGAPTITFVGNLTGDPELRFTPSGAAVSNFSVAVNERKFNKQTSEWEEGDTTFIRCAVWNEYAENVAESLEKGSRVIVTGTLRVRTWDKDDGETGTSVECNVDEVGPSLRWASARVTRTGKAADARGKGSSRQTASAGATRQGGSNPWRDRDDSEPPF